MSIISSSQTHKSSSQRSKRRKSIQRKNQRRIRQRTEFQKWRLGSINISTAVDDHRLEDGIRLIEEANLFACTLQEFRRIGVGSCIVEGESYDWEVHWSGFKRKREYGVGIAIRVMPGIDIGEIKCIDERLMTASLTIFGLEVKVVSAYAPTNEAKDSAKIKFYQNLKKIKPDFKHQQLLYTGDFNSTTEAVRKQSCVRAGKVLENIVSNDNGERLIDFTRDNNLSMLNTFFKQPWHRLITWHSRDKKTKKALDYHLSSDFLRQYCTNCRVYNGFKFQSDHRLLVSEWRTPKTKLARFVKRKKGKPSVKYDLTGFQDEAMKANFQDAVKTKLENTQFDDCSD